MIVYVGFAQPDEWADWSRTYASHASRFDRAAGGEFCLVAPFGHVTPERMTQWNPRAVILSGFARSFEEYEARSFDGVCGFIQEATETPILALCGSHQLLGYLYNGELSDAERVYDKPMRLLHAGEPVTNPDYHPEYFMERGFYPLELHGEDPLFDGCGRPPMVCESHYCEIKELPPRFRLLASTPECRVQAMRHESRPLVGLQFHPEDYTDRFPDGKQILRNFLDAHE